MHVIYIGKGQKCLGSSGEMKMAHSVTFSLWKLQYILWEVYLPWDVWVTVQIGRNRK